MAHANEPRTPRRHIRLPCVARSDGREFDAVIVNLSVTGFFVLLPLDAIDHIDRGKPVDLRFKLPSASKPSEGGCDVMWTNPNEVDLRGKKVAGVGLRLVHPSEELARQLQEFVETFRYSVLIVDDEVETAKVIARALRTEYHVILCDSAPEALEILQETEVGVLITDYQMPSMNGYEFLQRIPERFPRCHASPIVVSAFPDVDQLQDLINQGYVFAYLRKPSGLDDLRQIVRRGMDAYSMTVENLRLRDELSQLNQRLTRENTYLRQRVVGLEGFHTLIGNSVELRRALTDLERVRTSDATVFIQGETGTGKELVARALHNGGSRANEPFLAVNCGGMAETLLQSVLFGHKKGAFTGADKDQPGVFEQANGGTLFLDEVAEMSLPCQTSLLRALQEREITPIGAQKSIKVNVRLVSATHRDLRAAVREGVFREDLYFRLVVINVGLPPLRSRSGDVPLLARHFLDLYCERHGKNVPGFCVETMQPLELYQWPGNVRELENEVERLVVLADEGQKIPPQLLSAHIGRVVSDNRAPSAAAASAAHTGLSYDQAVEGFSRALIERALEESRGVVARAAVLLGMERSRLAKLNKRLNAK